MFLFISLNFNDSESVMLSFGSTFQFCSAATIFLMFLQTYCCTLLDYTLASKHSDLVNVTYLFLSSAFLMATPAPAPVIFMASFTSMYVSLQSQRLDFNTVILNFDD